MPQTLYPMTQTPVQTAGKFRGGAPQADLRSTITPLELGEPGSVDQLGDLPVSIKERDRNKGSSVMSLSTSPRGLPICVVKLVI